MNAILVTGASGGIGQALVRRFAAAGYAVIATDRVAAPDDLPFDQYLACDLDKLVADPAYAVQTFARLRQALAGRPLAALLNNAATQVIAPVELLSLQDWQATLNVNLLAGFLLVQQLLPELEASRGTMLNISSIHARLTKAGFVAYATSKAALSAMTRAMAVELGGRIQVNAIEPAAIETPMLRAGFENDKIGYERLREHHPAGCIGSPEALAALALSVVEAGTRSTFLNGAIIPFDGGIGARLHDPG